jgi:D-tyrosyl-tRNA(Tyr) deacylase
MRVVIQRVSSASVEIEGSTRAAIGTGLLVLAGIEAADTAEDGEWLASKIAALRIFDDDSGIMNRSLIGVNGELLLISQFTLHAGTKKGNRPSYIRSARPEQAVPLYERFIVQLESALGKKIGTGEFGADMKVSLVNDGPVTILMDSKNRE